MKEACHTFITQLHAMLETEDSDIVAWTENSLGFRILDRERFEEVILAKYYRHTKLASFQRQLNLYGFKKVDHGIDFGSYYHPLFYRGAGSSLKDIKRSAIRQSAVEEKLAKSRKVADVQAPKVTSLIPLLTREMESQWDISDVLSTDDDDGLDNEKINNSCQYQKSDVLSTDDDDDGLDNEKINNSCQSQTYDVLSTDDDEGLENEKIYSSCQYQNTKEAYHTFIAQLHNLLDTEDPSIISWTESSLGFRIKDTERFKEVVLTKYYRHTKLASFQRQLNLYGFKKLSHGPDMGAYYHPLFIRGAGSALKDITRSAIRQSAVDANVFKMSKATEQQESLTRPSLSPSRWDIDLLTYFMEQR